MLAIEGGCGDGELGGVGMRFGDRNWGLQCAMIVALVVSRAYIEDTLEEICLSGKPTKVF